MTVVTINQLEFIKTLTNFPETKNEDFQDIQNFLSQLGKSNVEDLNIDEASELIQIQLKRSVKFTFECGKEKIITKKERSRYTMPWDACFFHCEIGTSHCRIYDPGVEMKNTHLARKVNCADDDCFIKDRHERGKSFCERMRAVCGSCIGKFSFKLEEVTCIDCLKLLSHYSDQAKDILCKIELEEIRQRYENFKYIPSDIKNKNSRKYLAHKKIHKIRFKRDKTVCGESVEANQTTYDDSKVTCSRCKLSIMLHSNIACPIGKKNVEDKFNEYLKSRTDSKDGTKQSDLSFYF